MASGHLGKNWAPAPPTIYHPTRLADAICTTGRWIVFCLLYYYQHPHWNTSIKSKHLKGRFGPRVSDGHVFAPKEVSWDPVLVTQRFLRLFHGFWLVFMVFQGSFMVFHGFWLVSMVFQGSFMVFHGFWLVSMVFHGSRLVFHGFSPECTRPKLYPGPTIQSRSAARRAA